VRVTTARGTRDDLVAIERRVRPAGDHAQAPAVTDPPGGLRVVGSVDAGVQVALYPSVLPDTDEAPGMRSGDGTGWERGPSTPQTGTPSTMVVQGGSPAIPTPPRPAQMALVAYPGATADLPAIPGLSQVAGSPSPLRMTPVEVAGRPAMLIERRDNPAGWTAR
jgi:hypothetical protein